MKTYLQISFRNLKENKARTVTTVLGILISSMFMFLLLDLVVMNIMDKRQKIRDKLGYEAVFYELTDEQLKQMDVDYNVRKYFVGEFEAKIKSTGDIVLYPKAVYVIFDNPYYMRKDFKTICNELQVEGELNADLACLYEYRPDGSSGSVYVALSLLICFIAGAFAVIVTKTSVKISVTEHIRDYGLLRCVGASMKQLKRIIRLETIVMELPTTAVGCGLGYVMIHILVNIINLDLTVHFSGLAVLVTYLAMTFAMYFSSIEPCEFIMKTTIVCALKKQIGSNKNVARNEKRIKKRAACKLKKEWGHRSLYERIFGIEAGYAVRNINMNKRKYIGIGVAYYIGITMIIVGFCISDTMKDYRKSLFKGEVYYNVSLTEQLDFSIDSWMTGIGVESTYGLLTDANINMISNHPACADISERITSELYIENMDFKDIYSDDFIYGTVTGDFYNHISEKPLYQKMIMAFSLSGLENSDLMKFDDYVVEGTINPEELGDNGIVLVNYREFYKVNSDDLSDFKITNYKVGDTISFYDMEELEQLYSYYESREDISNYSDYISKPFLNSTNQLSEEGKVKECVIKGIVNVNIIDASYCESEYGYSETNTNPIMCYCTKDAYYSLTSASKDARQGFRIRINEKASSYEIEDFDSMLSEMSMKYNDEGITIRKGPIYQPMFDMYLELQRVVNNTKIIIVGITIILLTMSMVNVINISSNSVIMRKSELTQMRVVGMSKKRMLKMLFLENSMILGASVIGGITTGGIIVYAIYKSIILFGVAAEGFRYSFSFVGVLFALIISSIVIFISVLISLRAFKNNLVDDMEMED